MKSAYELAMERLEKQHGKVASTNAKQKKALGEIDQRAKAKKAETEILYRDRMKEAARSGDGAAIRTLEAEMKAEVSRIAERAETEKDAVRRDPSLA